MTRWWTSVLALAVCGLAGCGHDDSGRVGVDPPVASKPLVHVTTTLIPVPRGEPVFTEGSVPFTTLIDATGTRTELPPHVAVDVHPGAYVVRAGLRPCDGNCGSLDPPAATCRQQADLGSGSGDARITIALHSDGPCVIAVHVTARGPVS